MTTHRVTFDNGISSGSLSTSFSRNTATWQYSNEFAASGLAVSVNTPRYEDSVTVYPPRQVQVLDAATGAFRAYGAGLDANGDAIVVVWYGATSDFRVYRDEDSPTLLNNKILIGGTNKPASSITDLLHGEDAEEADYTHSPRGTVCLPGIILVNCCTHKYVSGDRTDPDNYTIDGVSLCYSTDNGATWKMAWRTGNLNNTYPPSDYGSEWAITANDHDRDGTKDDYWIGIASYASVTTATNPSGQRTAHSITTRVSGGVDNWSIGWGHIQQHPTGSSDETHIHYTMIHPWGTGLKETDHIGDTASDNRVEEWICTSKDNYLLGASQMVNGSGVFVSGSAWTGPTSINGRIGVTPDEEWMASQTISAAPGPNNGWYAGGDEGQGGPIFYATVPTGEGSMIVYQPAHHVFGTTIASGHMNWRCFTLNAWEYDASNPAVAAFISPGNHWNTDNENAGRILYKARNAEEFGILFAPRNEPSLGAQLRPVLTPRNSIWFGSSSASGLRRLEGVPSRYIRSQKGIGVGPGGNNKVLLSCPAYVATHASNTLDIGATPPVPAPTDVSGIHIIAGTGSVNLGHLRLTDNAIDKNHSNLLVQLLVYQPFSPGVSGVDTYFRSRFYSVEGTSSVATPYINPDRIETRGQFHLISYSILNGPNGDWNTTGVTDSNGLRLVMQMQTAGATRHPGEWYMWPVGVYEDIDSPPSYYIPAQTNGSGETLSVGGFTCQDSWTISAVGLLGGDTGRDCRYHNTGTFREVLTLKENDNKYIEISTDADTQVRITATSGSTKCINTVSNLPKFLRNDPIIVSVNYDGQYYGYHISVGGTAYHDSGMWASGTNIKPTSILFGQNNDGTVQESSRWLVAEINDSEKDEKFIGPSGFGYNYGPDLPRSTQQPHNPISVFRSPRGFKIKS